MDARERLTELLARRATAGLDAEEARELSGLLASHPEWDNDSFDRAAASIDLALAEEEPLPERLRERLVAAGRAFAADGASGRSTGRESAAPAVAEEQESAGVETPTGERPRPAAREREREGSSPPTPERPRRPERPMRRTGMPPWTGWLAAAAALVIALMAWWPRAQTPPATAEMRARLVQEATDLIQMPWQPLPDATVTEDAGGDVVWSPERQRGYMRIRGLRANDADVFQYQLWVFDAGRDDRYPVDGGVFDIPRGRDEVIVPIRNKLPVATPTRFAVTVERPGGVVVSSRERIVLLATGEG